MHCATCRYWDNRHNRSWGYCCVVQEAIWRRQDPQRVYVPMPLHISTRHDFGCELHRAKEAA